MGVLTGSTTVLAGTEVFNLSSPVQTDWLECHSATTPNRLSGGGSTIGLPTLLGSGVSFGTFAFGVGYTWTGGTPQASGTAVTEGIFVNATTATVGQGLQFTLPADTNSRSVTIYWGANSCAAQLVATLSDGSATAVTHTPTATGAGNSGYYSTTLTYAANAASQTLTIACTVKTLQSGGNTWLGAAKYLTSVATVTGAAASTQGPNVSAASGAVSVRATAASTQQSNVSTASASVGVTGSASSVQASNASAAGAKVSVSSAAAATQAKNSGAALGAVTIGAVGASSQAANVASASSAVLASSSTASTQRANVSAASAAISITGAASGMQAPNASSANASVGSVAQASAASTQSANVSSASVVVSAAVSAAAAQGRNVAAAVASVRAAAVSLSTQARNVSAASGAIVVSGSAAAAQARDVGLAAGSVAVSGSTHVTQQANVSSATALSGNGATATAASVQAPNVGTASARVLPRKVDAVMVPVDMDRRMLGAMPDSLSGVTNEVRIIQVYAERRIFP